MHTVSVKEKECLQLYCKVLIFINFKNFKKNVKKNVKLLQFEDLK